jgi:acetylornithine deacetylase
VLSSLIAIDTANPMGRLTSRELPIEREAILLIEQLFAPDEGKVSLRRQTCSPMHENLIVTWTSERAVAPALFESHIDTVPADGWADRAFVPRLANQRVFGLGACDDKGCLSAMIVAMLELLEERAELPRGLILVCAGDEEFAQTGIHRFLQDLPEPPAYGIFGEPTQLQPVIQHKGTVRWDITVHGRSAHTSRPELGINAILGMIEVILELQVHEAQVQARFRNPRMSGPTISVTQIAGGRTRNATPDECTVAVDYRVLPGMDPAEERAAIIARLESLPWKISHGPVQLMTPPLNTDPKSPLCEGVLSVCRGVIGSDVELRGEPYGTDAAWLGRTAPAIVLGPGDIRYAHAADEQIDVSALTDAVEIYKKIMMEPFPALA